MTSKTNQTINQTEQRERKKKHERKKIIENLNTEPMTFFLFLSLRFFRCKSWQDVWLLLLLHIPHLLKHSNTINELPVTAISHSSNSYLAMRSFVKVKNNVFVFLLLFFGVIFFHLYMSRQSLNILLDVATTESNEKKVHSIYFSLPIVCVSPNFLLNYFLREKFPNCVFFLYVFVVFDAQRLYLYTYCCTCLCHMYAHISL